MNAGELVEERSERRRVRTVRGLLAGARDMWLGHFSELVGSLAFAWFAAWAVARDGADRRLLDELVADRSSGWLATARFLSRWGELHIGPMMALALLALAGWRWRRIEWRTAALAGWLSTLVGGLTAMLLKICIGRPRPKVHVPDVLHGFTLDHHYHSFPSGHAAHWWSLVAAVAVLAPRWAAGMAVAAAAVCWSRLYLEQHYFGDIASGTVYGCAVGVCFGLAARRWLERRERPGDDVDAEENER